MFEEAFKITMKNEGFYSFSANDRGGETFRGIARNFHPEWAGWDIIDSLKENNLLSDIPDHENFILDVLTKKFYREKYWLNRRVNLGVISQKHPKVAIELFDIAVNMGVLRAAQFVQRTVNILNKDEKLGNNLKVDGWVGAKTISEIDKYRESYLLKLIILLKAKHYIDIVESNETQEKFIRGWINRINLN